MAGSCEPEPRGPSADPLAGLARAGRESLCPPGMSRISFGMATCGQAAGTAALRGRVAARADLRGVAAAADVGCLGACFAEPLVDVRTPDGLHYFFGNVDAAALWHVIRTARGTPSSRHLWAVLGEREPGVLRGFHDLETLEVRNPAFGQFFGPQTRRISGRCGLVGPDSLAEYVAAGGYRALARALAGLRPPDIIGMVRDAGLRGRGGAGFPAARKWETAARSADPVRAVIANADEGDPGAYMDRALLESDPHGVLEGLILASYAVGANRAYIFVRHEYPLAIQTLRRAIASAQEAGLLGSRILGSDFGLRVTLVESGGAFVCGEETAMLQVMAGRRGEPQPRPPYPAARGLAGHPTVISNVETLANVSWIVANGADAFRELGTAESAGTKIFCLAGDVRRAGFIEVPFGTGAEALIEGIGGTPGKSVKALQIGGPSGGIVPYAGMALDYETVGSAGAMMGSGGLVALGSSRCLVDMARHLVAFMGSESCGKCVICRDGLRELEAKLSLLVSGRAHAGVIEEIEDLGKVIAAAAQCGLGRSAANPVLSTLRYFRDEYEAHIRARCPALSCKALITFAVVPAGCSDCRCCFLTCPAGAVRPGAGKKRHFIDQNLCTNCWACCETCPNGCIRPVPREAP